ncbi:MAG: PLDc N-terminal domain-containing protein [Bdellovibrionales bacterium]|nr:PLDc N-terminal domain-containing protein [Bdellovibrionales bacterium]
MFRLSSDNFIQVLLTAHIFTVVGAILTVFLLRRVIQERRAPTSALAWVLATLFVPYIAIPFYFLLAKPWKKYRASLKSPLKLRHEPSRNMKNERVKSFVTGDAATELLQFASQTNVSELEEITSFAIFSSPEAIYSGLLEAIDGAEREICLMTFILGQDEVSQSVVRALCEKAQEGIKVYVLLDALGSLWSSRRFAKTFLQAGVQIRTFMPVLPLRRRWSAHLRNHRKITIVDGKKAIIGGANISNEYMKSGDGNSSSSWSDVSFLISGSAVTSLRKIFQADFDFASESPNKWEDIAPFLSLDPVNAACLCIASGPDVEENLFADALVLAMTQANERIWIVTPYFIPDEIVLRTLIMMKRAGKDIRLVTPMSSNHPLVDLARDSFLKQLVEAQVDVFLFRPGMLHSKLILIDDHISLVGSANLDRRSLYLNYEITLSLFSAEFGENMKGLIEDYIAHSVRFESTRDGIREDLRAVFEDTARLCAPLL